MKSLDSRIAELRVTATIKFVGNHYEGNRTVHDWKVTLRSNKTRRQYSFSMTSGDAVTEITVSDALNSLIIDSQCYFNHNGYRDFADDFGFDADDDEEMAKARTIYNACGKNYENLKRVFGNDIKALMFETESL